MNVLLEIYDEKKHYEMLSEWWKAHGWPPVPRYALPGLGLVATDLEGVPGAAWWCYLDNSTPVGMAEWLIADPEVPGKFLYSAIKAMFEMFRERAQEMGYNMILTSTRVSGLVKVLERIGFTKSDEGMTHMVVCFESKGEE
jgi:hypothetical protein